MKLNSSNMFNMINKQPYSSGKFISDDGILLMEWEKDRPLAGSDPNIDIRIYMKEKKKFLCFSSSTKHLIFYHHYNWLYQRFDVTKITIGFEKLEPKIVEFYDHCVCLFKIQEDEKRDNCNDIIDNVYQNQFIETLTKLEKL